jgi:hypothetical protein
VVVLSFIFTNLLLNKIVSINDKIKQLEISSQKREGELTLKDSVSSTKLDREKLIGYFVGPGDSETVEFTKYLEDLAKKMNVTQKKTLDYEAISGLPTSEVVSSIRYRFNISGSWNNVFNFLLAIESLPKVSLLSGVSFNSSSEILSAGEGASNKVIWSADLDFSVAKLKIK